MEEKLIFAFSRQARFTLKRKQLSGKPLFCFGRKVFIKGVCRLLVHIVSLRRGGYAGDAIRETGGQFLDQEGGALLLSRPP